ncbi:MAG: hypothetical protein MJ149_01090, partial [Clostridia bacterium]|nr:hypothetical protein [Clostridia bacterium]
MTKSKSKFIIVFALLFAMLACLVAPTVATFSAYAGNTDTLTLGTFDVSTSSFKDATATEVNTYQGLTISLASEIEGSENIGLPTVDGYTVAENISTQYSKVINISTAKTAKEIAEEYISNVTFANCGSQTVSVVLNKDATTNKVAYFADNEHYYMYVEDATKTWVEAYDLAADMEYMGRKGYLATITSLEEDTFIYKVMAGSIGWLGGTHFEKPAEKTTDGQHYSYTNPAELGTEDYWYWACGPEIDDKFFDNASVPGTDTEAEAVYTANLAKGYYFNWADDHSGTLEPSGGTEQCLATLTTMPGYSTGSFIDYYSWNDLDWNNWGVTNGYVVEFGDKEKGDTHTEETENFVSATGDFVGETDTLTLGGFDFTTNSFKDATATEVNEYTCITISLASDIVGTEEITLPEVDGYTVNVGLSTNYSKIINISTAKTAKEIAEEYIRKVTFANCNTQSLSIVLNKDAAENKVAYFANNDHYYMYVKDSTKCWDEAYVLARNMEYLGRQGYLATITSVEEDIFINKITGNEIGWLGGTDLIVDDRNGNYYEYINATTSTEEGDHQDHWIWACGPEIGQEFFDRDIIEERDADYRRNAEDNGYYFNWDTLQPEPNNSDEFCLTTLNMGSGYSTDGIITDYSYSWNNIAYTGCGTGPYSARGYVVEFGNKIHGDSHPTPKSTDYVAVNVDFHTHTEGAWEEWTTTDSLPTEAGNYYLGVDVTLTEKWEVPEGTVNFCLNGHVLDLNGSNIILKNATLNLFDCNDTTSHAGYVDATGLWHLGTGEGTAHTINGGVITGGVSTSTYGGAIELNENATLNVYDGTFAGNNAKAVFIIPGNGGAIYVSNNSKATIYGGNIEYNTADSNGGGISSAGDLTIYGGRIENNTATNAGAGVFCNDKINLTLGMEAYIYNNKLTGGTQSNLYSTREKFITLGSDAYAPGKSMFVGVALESVSGVFVDAGYKYDEYLEDFVSDNPGCIIIKAGDYPYYSLNLVTVHQITNDRPADGATSNHGYLAITPSSIEGCEIIVDGLAITNDALSITIVANDGYMMEPGSLKINDGNVPIICYEDGAFYMFVMPDEDIFITAKFVETSTYPERATNEITNFKIESWTYGDTPSEPILEAKYGAKTAVYLYVDMVAEKYLTEKPTNAGYYYVYVSIDGTDEYMGISAYTTLEILQAENGITGLTMADWKVGGTPSTPSATATFGTIVYTYSDSEEGEYTKTLPTEVGTYWVKAEVEGTDNYTGAVAKKSFKIKSDSGKQEIVIEPIPCNHTYDGE